MYFFVFTWSSNISIETAKQKMERDSLHQKAKVKVSRKRKQITELQKEFKQLLNLNESLPEHLHLTHEVHVHRHKSNTLERICTPVDSRERLLQQCDTGRQACSR